MTGQFRLFWEGRTPREQRMLLVMFALLAVVILWLGIARPLGDALSDSRARLARAGEESGLIAMRADELRAARRLASARVEGSLVSAIGLSASEAGFELARNDAQGDERAMVAMTSAKGAALFAWLGSLQARGIFVERIALRPNSDGTLAVDATLRARRS